MIKTNVAFIIALKQTLNHGLVLYIEVHRVIKYNNYKDCFSNNEIILKSQQRFKSEAHDIYIEEINKIVLSSNDDKTLQIFDRITWYPHGTSVEKVCKTELLSKYKRLILMIIQLKMKQSKI